MSQPQPPPAGIWLVVAMLGGMSAGLAALGAHFGRPLTWILTSSARAEGRIVDVAQVERARPEQINDPQLYYARNRHYEIAFDVPGSGEHLFFANGADADVSNRWLEVNKRAGDRVPILYDAHDPAKAVRLAVDETWIVGTALCWLFALIFAAAGVRLASVLRRDAAERLRVRSAAAGR